MIANAPFLAHGIFKYHHLNFDIPLRADKTIMSGLEIPGFLVGVAGLFSSCIDAFSYFKTAQHADHEIEVLLLKLDIEKSRLLVWGNEMQIFSMNRQGSWLRDQSNVALLERVFLQIDSLFTNSEKLRKYGLRVSETPLGRAIDYVSSRSMAVFYTSSKLFWVRNALKLKELNELNAENRRRSLTARAKWAIYEKEKFQGLINEVKHFVDHLYEVAQVDLKRQEDIIVTDIESIVDISQLRLVEEATEGSYRVYSEAALSARASTVARFDDLRTIEEHLRDTEEFTQQEDSGVNTLLEELSSCRKHFVLTSKCRKMHTSSPCDVLQLGSEADYYKSLLDISSYHEFGGNTLWQTINRLINVKSIAEESEQYETLAFHLLREKDSYLSGEQRGILKAMLPLLNVYIYCSPCVCLIHTALRICAKISTPLVRVLIRPDDRLLSSCCVDADRIVGLKSIVDWVRDSEAEARPVYSYSITQYLDRIWAERRLDHFEYEEPYNYKEVSNCEIIVIGEGDYLAPILQKAPGRIPKAMDIWAFEYRSHDKTCVRHFQGRFIESKETRTDPVVMPIIAENPKQDGAESTEFKRPLSPISSDSKRQRVSVGSGDEDEETEEEESSR